MTSLAARRLWYINRAEFKKWVKIYVRGKCLQREGGDVSGAFPEIAPCFDQRFPVGLKVRAVGLAAKPELNGRVGTVAKHDEAKLRVGVEFAPPHGLLSLKHTNVEVEDGGAARSAMLLKRASRGV